MNTTHWNSYNFIFYFRAQQVFANNFFAVFYSMYLGLLAILAIPSILNVLVFTEKSSSDQTAYKRYMQTIYHTLSWFRYDLKPGTKAWKSLAAVRKFHFSASKSAQKATVGLISQKDMAITQYGFIGFIVLSQKQTGVQASRDEMEDYCHLWRVLGHIIGIKDELIIISWCQRFETYFFLEFKNQPVRWNLRRNHGTTRSCSKGIFASSTAISAARLRPYDKVHHQWTLVLQSPRCLWCCHFHDQANDRRSQPRLPRLRSWRRFRKKQIGNLQIISIPKIRGLGGLFRSRISATVLHLQMVFQFGHYIPRVLDNIFPISCLLQIWNQKRIRSNFGQRRLTFTYFTKQYKIFSPESKISNQYF